MSVLKCKIHATAGSSDVARQCAGPAGPVPKLSAIVFFQVNLTDVDVYKDTVGNLFIEF